MEKWAERAQGLQESLDWRAPPGKEMKAWTDADCQQSSFWNLTAVKLVARGGCPAVTSRVFTSICSVSAVENLKGSVCLPVFADFSLFIIDWCYCNKPAMLIVDFWCIEPFCNWIWFKDPTETVRIDCGCIVTMMGLSLGLPDIELRRKLHIRPPGRILAFL